jgi:hypothetical protein
MKKYLDRIKNEREASIILRVPEGTSLGAPLSAGGEY